MGKQEFYYVLFDQNIITKEKAQFRFMLCFETLFLHRHGSVEASTFARDSNPLKVNLVHIVCGFFLGSPFPYSQNAV